MFGARPHVRNELRSGKHSTIFLLIGLFVLAFLFQGNRGVFETTEGRYSSIASEMIRLHDWITPRLDEETPHFTKPPLTYWLLAASIEVFGRTDLAPRIPGVVAFVLTTLVLVRAGRLMVPRQPILPALIYASCLLPATASNVVSTDNLLAFAETAAMVAFAEHYFGVTPRRFPAALTGWIFLSLAFLTKGYPALLPLAALVVFHRVRGRSLFGKQHLQVAPGIAIFAAVGAAWFAVVIWRDPALLRYFVVDELVGRVSGEHNRNPEWYKAITVYGPVLLLGTVPWTLHAGRAVAAAFRSLTGSALRTRGGSAIELFLLLWLLLPTAVFLVARSRLELYLLPQFAPLAILTAMSVSGRGGSRRSIAILCMTGAVAILALRFASGQIHSDENSHPVASQIAALSESMPSEVVFVEDAPYRGVAFYLDTEVERVVFSDRAARSLGVETVYQELLGDERDRLWLVPVSFVDRFRSLAASLGYGSLVSVGTVVTSRPQIAFVLDPAQRVAGHNPGVNSTSSTRSPLSASTSTISPRPGE